MAGNVNITTDILDVILSFLRLEELTLWMD